MRQIKIILEYEGTAYGGWQRQAGIATIQQVLEEKLAVLLRHPAKVVAAGRTDAGVHAQGQVVSFTTDATLTLARIRKGLNGLLPRDIAVLEATEAPGGFNPRRDARGKRYRYLVWNHLARSPLLRHRAWHVREALNLAAMRAGAKELLGEHDFSAFRATGCESKTAIRDLRLLEITRCAPDSAAAPAGHGGPDEPGLIAFDLEATAFLRFMVRNIVGTLVEVGLGRRGASDMIRILEGRDRAQAGQTAPAQGLTLLCVYYEGG